MTRTIRHWLAALALAALPAVAQADIFMLVQGVPGDVGAKGHEKWIRVTSLDWRMEAESSWTKGGGASVGKPNPNALQLVLPTGTWSQHFARLIGLGKNLPTIVFDALSSDGRPLYRITAEAFYVTEYRLESAAATLLPQDHVSGVFRKVKVEYYATSADGKLVTTFFEWEIPTGIVLPLF